jgi:hypothetical protein
MEKMTPTELDRHVMGSPEGAHEALVAKAREWRALRQPQIATSAELKRNDVRESQVRFELANAALLWLWHEEHPE